MSQSSTLRVAELRAVVQLVGECRELGDDTALWRRHLLAGLARLVRGGVAMQRRQKVGHRKAEFAR
jgi:hypothetical protein